MSTLPKPNTDIPEVMFIGRSNVGKSSLVNMLCNRKALASTSATPGRLVIIYIYIYIYTYIYICIYINIYI